MVSVRDNVREHPAPLRIRTDNEPDREFRLTGRRALTSSRSRRFSPEDERGSCPTVP